MRTSLASTSLAVWTLICPLAAFADLSNTVTLSTGQTLSLDTGVIASSAGDIQFTGASITLQGDATEYPFPPTGITGYGSLLLSELTSITGGFSQSPISSTSQFPLGVNDVFAVHTNGGNYAKVVITALSATSLTLEFYTFGAAGTGISGPTITAVQNNYSYLSPGQPSYGIAPGALFVIKGTNLASGTTNLQSSAPPGLPPALDGASVSVTVGGVTTHPAFYYAMPEQLALVLPSSTPLGTGVVTVTYTGGSSSASIPVVQSALGFDTSNGAGFGPGNVTDNVTGKLLNYANSAAPGQVIVLWGSGLGADTADSDSAFTTTPHAISVPLQIYIGGIQASIVYQGSSGYPGLNQIDVTVPQGVQPGCRISIVAVSGSVVSNTVTIPVNPGGGACSDPVLGVSGEQLSALGSKNTYNAGSVGINQTLGNLTPALAGEASFLNVPGANALLTPTSLGNCSVNSLSSTPAPDTATGLDAGTLNLPGPTGTQSLTEGPAPSGTGISGHFYSDLPAGFVPAMGGTFTFTASGGTTPGASVSAFTATPNLGAPPVWSNMSSITAIDRTQPLTVTWTGGSSYAAVSLTGATSSPFDSGADFTCLVPASAGQLTVPSYVLAALPAEPGELILGAQTANQTFFATGLDIGTVTGRWAEGMSVPYN